VLAGFFSILLSDRVALFRSQASKSSSPQTVCESHFAE